MAKDFPGKESKENYRKEINDIFSKSNYYRSMYAEKAVRMSRINGVLELLSFGFSVLIAGTMTAAVSGFIKPGLAQILALIFSALIALISGIIKPFFNPEEFIKLFYASGEFLEIKEKAKEIWLRIEDLSIDELRVEYHRLNNEYTNLKKIYIEYIQSPYSYYKRKRKLKVPGKRFTQLPSMRQETNKG